MIWNFIGVPIVALILWFIFVYNQPKYKDEYPTEHLQ